MAVTTTPLIQNGDQEPFTKHQRTFLLLFGANSFINATLYSIGGPLYPPEASSKGFSPSEYGVFMSFNCGTMAVASFFITGMEKFGLRFCFILSNLVCGMATILLGALHFCDSTLFAFASMTAFALNGIASALFIASAYLLCLIVFPTRTALAIAIIEGSNLIATCFGPIFCEVIFTFVGYTATYMCFAVAPLTIGVITFCTLPHYSIDSNTLLPTFKEMMSGYVEIAKHPSILIFVIILVALQLGMDFLTSMLETALRPFHLSRIHVGLTFFSVGSTSLLAPLWGRILDRSKFPEFYLIGSLLTISLGSLLLSGFIKNLNYTGTVVALVIYGFGQGIMDIAAVVNFQLEVKEKQSYVKTRAVHFSFIAIVYTFTIGIGGLLGPSLSGLFFVIYGFAHAILFISIIDLALAVILIVYMVQRKCQPRALAMK